MLSKEQQFFLSALSDHINGEKTSVPDGIDESLLLSLSGQQQTDSIMFCQTHLSSFQSSFAFLLVYSANRRKQLDDIHNVFSSSNIRYLIFKGVEIASYYPSPDLRQMGDIDILVHPEDKEKAADVLGKIGFVPLSDERPADHEWIFFKEKYELELHHRLLYSDNMNEDNYISFSDQSWDYAITSDGIQYHLEPEFHFIYLILHLRKHLIWAGIGIRQFLDLAVMIKNADMNWEKVEGYLSLLNLLPFSQICFALVERWFGITAPIVSANITDDFFECVTNTILSDGLFGCLDEESMLDNSILNKTRKQGRIRTTLLILFPPYKQMKEKYPGMGKCPLLLPVMWIRRMIDSVIHKSAGKGLDYASKHLIKSDKMKEREEMLKKWGL